MRLQAACELEQLSFARVCMDVETCYSTLSCEPVRSRLFFSRERQAFVAFEIKGPRVQ